MKKKWEKIVFADDLPPCPDCEEPFCEKHNMHYADCPCLGPTQDGVEYTFDESGILMGRLR